MARAARKGVKITPPSRELLDHNQLKRAERKRAQATVFIDADGREMIQYPYRPRQGAPLLPPLTMRRELWDAFWSIYPECYPKQSLGGDAVGYWRLHGLRRSAPCRDAPLARIAAVLLGKPPNRGKWRAVCADGDNSNFRDENIVLVHPNLTRATQQVIRETRRRMHAANVNALGSSELIRRTSPRNERLFD